MRILVVNVNTSQTMTSVIEAGARRYASAGTQIIALRPYLRAAAVGAIVAEAGVAVGADHAEVICLGCAGMAGLEEAITSELHVPVVDGVGAAVRLAEAIIGLGLKTSKVSTFSPPEPKKIMGWPLSPALGLRPGAGCEEPGSAQRHSAEREP